MLWLVATIFLASPALLTSCANDDNSASASPKDQAEYAILFYGYGGRTLDEGIMQNMLDFYKGKAESYDKVKIAVQYKFSSIENIKKYMLDPSVASGDMTQEEADAAYEKLEPMGLETIRYIVDPSTEDAEEQVLLNTDNIYGQKDCDIAHVDSLTNFINWAVKACSAKHYVLIVSDHGFGYLPHDDLPFEVPAQTRGLFYDDDTYKDPMHFTVSSMRYALEHANKHMDVVYFDACLMNTIEYQFELKDVADYLILSTFVVPDMGGCYELLIDELASTPNIETALGNYNKACVEKWDKVSKEWAAAGETEYEWDYHDMSVTRTSSLDAFGSKLREFVDKLVVAYGDEGNKTKIDNETKCAFKVDNECPGYDLIDYTRMITLLLPHVYGDAFTDELLASFNNCVVSRYCSDFLIENDMLVDCSVLLAVKGNYYCYNYDRNDPTILNSYKIYYADGKLETYFTGIDEQVVTFWPSTLKDTYEQLAFDKATGWSRWLYLNEQMPCEDSPVERHYPYGE